MEGDILHKVSIRKIVKKSQQIQQIIMIKIKILIIYLIYKQKVSTLKAKRSTIILANILKVFKHK